MKHNLSEIVEYINTDNVRFKEPYIEKRNIKVGNFYIIAHINKDYRKLDACKILFDIVGSIDSESLPDYGFIITPHDDACTNVYIGLVEDISNSIPSGSYNVCSKCGGQNVTKISEDGELFIECLDCGNIIKKE